MTPLIYKLSRIALQARKLTNGNLQRLDFIAQGDYDHYVRTESNALDELLNDADISEHLERFARR